MKNKYRKFKLATVKGLGLVSFAFMALMPQMATAGDFRKITTDEEINLLHNNSIEIADKITDPELAKKVRDRLMAENFRDTIIEKALTSNKFGLKITSDDDKTADFTGITKKEMYKNLKDSEINFDVDYHNGDKTWYEYALNENGLKITGENLKDNHKNIKTEITKKLAAAGVGEDINTKNDTYDLTLKLNEDLKELNSISFKEGGANKIYGLSNGEVSSSSKEAINGSQLHNAKEELNESINNINTALNNFKNLINPKVEENKSTADKNKQDLTNLKTDFDTTKQNLGDRITALENKPVSVPVLRDNPLNVKFNKDKTEVDFENAKLKNVENGEISVNSKEAVNGSQLYTVKDTADKAADKANQNLEKINDLTNKLNTSKEELNNKVNEVKAVADKNKEDITNLKTGLDTAKQELNTVKATAEKNKEDLSNLKTGLDTAKQDLNNKIDANTNLINQNSNKINEVKAVADKNKEDLSNLKNDFDTTKEDFNNRINNNKNKIEIVKNELDTAKTDLDNKINENKIEIVKNRNRIEIIEDQIKNQTFEDKSSIRYTTNDEKNEEVVLKENAGLGTKIRNVASGEISEKSTEAVNGSQLYELYKKQNNIIDNVINLDNKIDKVNKKVDNLKKESRAGIANAVAMSNLPQAYKAGGATISAGVGNFKNAAALAVGYSRMSDNGKVIIKLSGSGDTKGTYAVGASVGYNF